jgi:hemolysin III
MSTDLSWVPQTSTHKIRAEWANQITHALGLLLSLTASVVLIRAVAAGGDVWTLAGAAVYCASLVSVYAASTLSHSFAHPAPRHFFRTVDQICIFLLIAGSYTPVALVYLRDGYWPVVLVAMWACALAGIGAKLFVRQLGNVNAWFYVATGWIPLLSIGPMLARLPDGSISLVLAGGLCYTGGVLFLLRDHISPYYHALWHLAVIAGSACHYAVIYTALV